MIKSNIVKDMLKANELMIGDLVTFKDCQNDENPTIIKIWQINADGDAFVSIDGHDGLDEISIDDEIVGIPITPEILEKNGWKHKYYGIYRQTIGETITIDVFPEGCSIEDERGSQCRYRPRYHLPGPKFVHELQHALRLCGIEKEITLN